ncbi:two-component response regulator-like APRR9 isoform X1 [Juglans microcarpa x Juglans regia]|uniref:two-component response regulator-like APRR9 isoform X1 n=1 Tax=Juglans microcarpa x Juglans regia TaxID=2249226 RepID=UPI001B7ECA8C|nr:two-component response regulator-like APRR9 isoform X1 [Juglans microcarpa x Juglans regia]
MGEVVVSSEELEARAESETEKMEEDVEVLESVKESGIEKKKKNKNKKMKEKRKGGLSSGVVRWERFLPRMMLRVLLVEADDSTRQIIAALLRKCSYRVVAVSDGLKAWEILKERAHNIDLILTEVDLPAISGFALLTLIMEHEICKNIPVIMMSSQDSISTVYKCMLRGASDYLVKPIRRNELRNLWQHVWRRQTSKAGVNNPQDESVAQEKTGATSENNAASNCSNGRMACGQEKNELIEKGSDSQSSCTKPELEAESASMENMKGFSQSRWGKLFPSDVISQKDETCIRLGQKLPMHETDDGGSVVDACKNANKNTLGKDLEPESQRREDCIANEASDNSYVIVNSSREAADLIGTFCNYPNCTGKGIGEFDSSLHLELSLKRSHPGGFWNEHAEKRRTLGHSNSSAFTRYTNKPFEPPQTIVANCDHQKEHEKNSENMVSNIFTSSSSDTAGLTQSTQRSIVTLATGQSRESVVATSSSQQKIFPVPVPAKGVRINNLCTGFGSILSPSFCPSPISPMLSPGLFAQQEPSFHMDIFYQSNLRNGNPEQHHDPHIPYAINTLNPTMHKHEHKFDFLEDRGHISPATDQSESNSFWNGGASNHSSIGDGSTCGSNGNVDHIAFAKAASENKNEGFLTPSGSAHRSIQREVALTKFRLKRKERCYEKKVRYESRKKLAQQRPRVKGQFVRQVQNYPPPAGTDGDSFDG